MSTAEAALSGFDLTMLTGIAFVAALELFVVRAWLGTCLQRAISLLKAAWTLVSVMPRMKPAGSFEQQVRRLYDQNRVHSFRKFLQAFTFVHALSSISVSFRMISGSGRWMTDLQTACMLGLGLCYMGALVIPNALSSRTIAFWHCLLQLTLSLFLLGAPASEGPSLWYSLMSVWICRAFCCLASGCGLAVNIVVYALWAGTSFAVTDRDRRLGPDSMLHLLYEASIGVMVVVVTSGLLNAAWTNAAREVTAGIMQSESAAMTRMLDCLCDCTFELDAELQFRSDVPTLSSIIASRAASVKRGSSFQALFAFDEDKARFEKRLATLRESSQEPGAASADVETVTLRDVMGHRFKVDVYFARYELFSEEVFLIGLREVGDHTVSALVPIATQLERRSARYLQEAGGGASAACDNSAEEEDDLLAPSATAEGAAQGSAAASGSRHGRGPTTPGKAMHASVTRAMRSWVLPDTVPECCSYHAATKYLERITERCCVAPCQPRFYEWAPEGRRPRPRAPNPLAPGGESTPQLPQVQQVQQAAAPELAAEPALEPALEPAAAPALASL